jgi:hypothetical protein
MSSKLQCLPVPLRHARYIASVIYLNTPIRSSSIYRRYAAQNLFYFISPDFNPGLFTFDRYAVALLTFNPINQLTLLNTHPSPNVLLQLIGAGISLPLLPFYYHAL